MVEAASYLLAILLDVPRCRLVAPIVLGSLQKTQRTDDIGMCKGERVFDGAVDMTLGSKVDDAVYLLVFNELTEIGEVADIHLDKLVVGLVLNILQVG